MYHHVALAVKDVDVSHRFYTESMGFDLVKVVKRQSPTGGWTKHIFYDTGDGELFAIWDLTGLPRDVLDPDQWSAGMSTGANLPNWINHIAFDCGDEEGLQRHKELWLETGYSVMEVDHEFIRSVYTLDPDGTMVEFTYETRPLNNDDRVEAIELFMSNEPAMEPSYDIIVHKSKNLRRSSAARSGAPRS